MQQGSFSFKLAEAMRERNIGARTLGRMISPDDVERGRRNVRRWLRGTTANKRTRAEICRTLGLPEKALEPDEDVDQALMRELIATRERFDAILHKIEGRAA